MTRAQLAALALYAVLGYVALTFTRALLVVAGTWE